MNVPGFYLIGLGPAMLTSPSPNWSNSIIFADAAELDCKVPYDVDSISKMPMPEPVTKHHAPLVMMIVDI